MDGHVYYNKVVAGPADAMDLTKPVVNVTITMTGAHAGVDTTDPGTGAYFIGPTEGNITLTPSKLVNTGLDPNDWTNALSASDASLIAKSVVLLVQLSPVQKTAGDVTGNGTLSSLDASLVATKAVNQATVFPVRTITGNDFAFFPGAKPYSPLPGPGTTSFDFDSVLYGDVSCNWISPESFDAPIPPAVTATDGAAGGQVGAMAVPGQGAVLYLARGPARTADGHWQAVLGLQNADGIMGLDLEFTYDPAIVTMRSIQGMTLAAGFGIEKNLMTERSLVSVYGAGTMTGTGDFLLLTFDMPDGTSGLPVTVGALANEGQLPLTWSPGLPPAGRTPSTTLDE